MNLVGLPMRPVTVVVNETELVRWPEPEPGLPQLFQLPPDGRSVFAGGGGGGGGAELEGFGARA